MATSRAHREEAREHKPRARRPNRSEMEKRLDAIEVKHARMCRDAERRNRE